MHRRVKKTRTNEKKVATEVGKPKKNPPNKSFASNDTRAHVLKSQGKKKDLKEKNKVRGACKRRKV